MAPFSERLTLAIVGPLVTVILGTLIIGGLIQLITSRSQNRRAKEEQRLEQRRSDNNLRHELLSDMTEAASALYLATQRYWRAKRDKQERESSWRARRSWWPRRGKQALVVQEVSDARKALDDQYHKSRARGEILESRLSAYFASSEPQETWHKVMDLLTVRYFQVIGTDTEKLNRLYRDNEKGFNGKEHSGLTMEQFRASEKDSKVLLDAYRAALNEAAEVVRTESLRPRVG
jgi:hypothetical protein